jgi:hypothetical protein
MDNRIVVLGAALAMLALGIWASYLGWRQEWTANGVMLRGGGLIAIVAAIYFSLRGRKA